MESEIKEIESIITGEKLGKINISSTQEIYEKVAIANNNKSNWVEMGLDKRLEYLQEVYNNFELEKENIAKLITHEMGMPLKCAIEEVESGLNYYDWYLKNARETLKPEITYEDEEQVHKLIYEPKGVVAVIVAWNFPFSNFIWQVIQTLIVGNVVVMKHSEYTMLTAKKIEDIMQKVLPIGVFTEVYGGPDIGRVLIHNDVDLICFTGSTKVGQEIYKIASEKFIPVLVELGGSAAGIVLEDASIDDVINSIDINRLFNSGQICDGLKRLMVHKNIYLKLKNKLIEFFNSKVVGNPFDDNTDLGPLVSKKQADMVEEQVIDAINKGAKLLSGKRRENTNYFEPILLENITNNMRIYKEEVFGPVLPLIEFENIDEAIKIANDTDYGLGGYVFTNDSEKYKYISNNLKTGMVTQNNLTYVIPQDPFGGVKKSGIGRNNGKIGFLERCNIKLIVYKK